MLDDGTVVPIVSTIYDADRATILHVPAEGAALPRPGARVIARIDWELRYKRMRAHTALHLLSVVAPYPVTGGSVGDAEGRLDFDSGEAVLDKAEIESRLNALIARDAAVSQRWIADAELEANPSLIKTMSVKPPMGTGRVRLIAIEGLDLQPCGGTHVARTGEIGRASVTGIEKKGQDQPARAHRARRLRKRIGNPMPSRNFLTTAELAAELGDANLGVIDASWHLPNSGRAGAAEFREKHIPGAVFFDIDMIADHDEDLPHMLPKPDALAKAMTALGLGDGMRFVVYDALGLYAAARVWWTLRAYGVEDVRILEGGLPRWIKEGRPRGNGRRPSEPTPLRSPASTDGFVASLDKVRAALASGSAQVVDARPAERFRGAVPEPRPGVRSGHIPGSLNLPFVDIVEHGSLKAAGRAQGRLRRAQDRPHEADHHHLRIGRHRRHPGAGGGGGRRRGRGPL